ncbi:MAG: tyrosine-type recombinase/integrase [Terracidiphilus sp.]
MIEKYFSASKALARLRAGISGPHIDDFAGALEKQGYAHSTAIRYLRAAAHLGCFVQRKGCTLADVDRRLLDAFIRHLQYCRCPHSNDERTGFHPSCGVKLFYRHLVLRGVCRNHQDDEVGNNEPALVTAFSDWFQVHRGVTQPTLRQYTRGAAELLQVLGEDVSQWNAQAVRAFLLDRASKCGTETTQKLITAMRAFLRYLIYRGEARDDLDLAVPAIAHWRLATLPQCLSAQELDRLIAACDGTTPGRLRDRAIVLLLSRLGLRAGDVAQLRIIDINWKAGTVQVTGKGRRQVRLPLPQDVGDALLRYLTCRPQVDDASRLFLRSIAPFKPFSSGDGVSTVVKHALRRAGIESQAKGAHLLRHTAATEMLRHGVPLDKIGLVLRHRSIDMTAYYAKVDFALLQQVAQPWPEVNS